MRKLGINLAIGLAVGGVACLLWNTYSAEPFTGMQIVVVVFTTYFTGLVCALFCMR